MCSTVKMDGDGMCFINMKFGPYLPADTIGKGCHCNLDLCNTHVDDVVGKVPTLDFSTNKFIDGPQPGTHSRANQSVFWSMEMFVIVALFHWS